MAVSAVFVIVRSTTFDYRTRAYLLFLDGDHAFPNPIVLISCRNGHRKEVFQQRLNVEKDEVAGAVIATLLRPFERIVQVVESHLDKMPDLLPDLLLRGPFLSLIVLRLYFLHIDN